MKKRSEEFCQLTSRRQKGKGNSFYGRKHTPEALKKIRQHTIYFNKIRIRTLTPFQVLQKEMFSKGYSWCRECMEFYLIANVHSGLCRHHQNLKYREAYAKNPEQIRLQKYARKRNLIKIPIEHKNFLFEKFNNECAYCGDPATSMDHFYAVDLGGNSSPDNLLLCCISCNSKKKNKHPSDWNFELTEDIVDIIIPSLFHSGQIHHILN